MSDEREFDIVLYGATGFVGQLTAARLAAGNGGARIALAGRSMDRLEAVRDGIGESAQSWSLMRADAEEPPTLADVAARARVVATTVGPYVKSGMPLVASCAAAGTDYTDLCGEAIFVHRSAAQYHNLAAETGARIVHACGADSIPSDMNVFALHRQAQSDDVGTLTDTVQVARTFTLTMSGGSANTVVEVMRETSRNRELRRAVNDPYTSSTDRAAEPDLGRQPDMIFRRGGHIAPELDGIWAGAFVMAVGNTRIVRRSNALQDWAYGRTFRYSECMDMGSSPIAAVRAAAITGAMSAMTALGDRFLYRVPRELIDKFIPKSGSGPSAEERAEGSYHVETYTTTTGGARYRASMSQDGDPGYDSTSLLLAESTLALALDRDKLSDQRGVLTPAAAMGDALLARLPKAGVTMDLTKLA
ncbi:saccharopine dehydrogenase family protein [Mycolicibacterium sphagni]|uniref:Enoyl-ACP reductase n=1 Tax=Mycolicibacterium sphagni TaxID=1786 RepID=A0A255DCP3_9MYCO|nr:saccharopine dehydrogenase NADP-binding domain-containing protein [Mycolicibacterium sphagni]MCV7177928.1 saccharopine dehydrogenase NADP-binding domain-containing protein [Mycolicibacterium sphagni]OYN76381.1 enoyl-ACP reductase [Mycolicibacterium sphagni]